MFVYDMFNITLAIRHWIRIIEQIKLIILCWRYYFELFVFVPLLYFFPYIMNRKVLKSNMFIQASEIQSSQQAKNKFVYFICFIIFYVYEYSFHAYIIDERRFLSYTQNSIQYVLKHFEHKIYKDLELYQVFIYNFLC